MPTTPISLRDLAVLYLALAHGTDADLDDTELDLIAARIHEWQQREGGEDATAAVQHARAAYDADDRDAVVEASIERLRVACDEAARRAILDDLIDIAMADNRFLHEESAFIHRLTQSWEIHPAPRARALWSVLDDNADTDVWTPVHDLALLYIALAHQTDALLDRSELDAIGRKLSGWLPRARTDEVKGVLQAALRVYAEGFDDALFARAVASVKAAIPRHQHAALLADLHYVARADGVMLVEEKTLIVKLAAALGLDVPG